MKIATDSYTIKCNVKISNGINNIVNLINILYFNKLIRIYAYVLRFINNCKKLTSKLTEILDIVELDNSLRILIKSFQSESFHDETQTVLDKKTCPVNLTYCHLLHLWILLAFLEFQVEIKTPNSNMTKSTPLYWM